MPDYPDAAGYKEVTTSLEAAEKIERSGRAATLRAKVQRYFEEGGRATADEVASLLGENILAIRPRVAELNVKGLIEPTGERHRNLAGGMAHVWRWKKPPPPQQGKLL